MTRKVHGIKNGWLFFLLAIIFTSTKCFAADDLTIKDHEGWHALDGETRAELKQNLLQAQTGSELLDLSARDAGGFGMLSVQKYPKGINRAFAEQTLAGFLHGAASSGYTVKLKETATVGPLPGFRIVVDANINKTHAVTATWLLFTKHEVYSVNVYDFGDVSAPTATEKEYLSRIRLSPSIEPLTPTPPLTVTTSQPHGPGYKAGRAAANFLPFFLLGVIFLVFFALRRRTPPPQIPDAAAKSEPDSNSQPPDKPAP